MSKDLSKIYSRLQKTIKVNFSQPLVIDGIIETINVNDHLFVIRSLGGNNAFECRTQDDLSNFKEKDRITIKGWLKLFPDNSRQETTTQTTFGKMFIAVEYIYAVSEKEKRNNEIEMYNRLQKTINTEKCQNAIKKITPLIPPEVICNIGLIILPDNNENVCNFKIAFQEKCFGKLFVFKLKTNMVDSSLESAFEYFKKYHNIDLICLLTNQMSLQHICDMSSRNNVKYMINRKNSPYIISVVSDSIHKTTMEPLSVSLSNAKVDGISGCIDFIHQIQVSFRKQLEIGIERGRNILLSMINNEKKKLFNYKMCIAELADPRIMGRSNDSPFDKLKVLIIQRLNRERHILHSIKTIIMKNIIDDPRVQNFFNMMVEAERKKINETRQVSQPQPQTRLMNYKDDDIFMNRLTSQENVRYVPAKAKNNMQPINTTHTTQPINVTEIDELALGTKKIEKNLSNNIQEQMLSIIQTDDYFE